MNRRPSDLSAAEAETQRWFDALPRATAPVFVGGGLSSGSQERAATAFPRPMFGAWFRPFAAAAAVLLALALPAQGAATSQVARAPHSPDTQQFEVAVVDDPSVPMLHGLETFDQLACLAEPGFGSSGLGNPGSDLTGTGGR